MSGCSFRIGLHFLVLLYAPRSGCCRLKVLLVPWGCDELLVGSFAMTAVAFAVAASLVVLLYAPRFGCFRFA